MSETKSPSDNEPNPSDGGNRFLPIMAFVISLLVLGLSGFQMVKNWFNPVACISFLTSLSACISFAVAIIGRLPKHTLCLLLKIGLWLLSVSIVLFLYFHCLLKTVLQITAPDSDEQVGATVLVSGSYRNIPLDQEIWIVSENLRDGLFYLGDAVKVSKQGAKDGTWTINEFPMGSSYSDGGKPFAIWAILIADDSLAKATILRYKNDVTLLPPNNLPNHLRSEVVAVFRQQQ